MMVLVLVREHQILMEMPQQPRCSSQLCCPSNNLRQILDLQKAANANAAQPASNGVRSACAVSDGDMSELVVSNR